MANINNQVFEIVKLTKMKLKTMSLEKKFSKIWSGLMIFRILLYCLKLSIF